MKNSIIYIKRRATLLNWIHVFLLLPLIWGCEKEPTGCLPYEGEIFPVSYKGIFGASCNGIVIKVTNASVNSFMEVEGSKEENVIIVRIPDGIGFNEFFGFPIDESKVSQRFHFNFRELPSEEYNVCTMEYSEPYPIMYMTDFSLKKCEND